ncbi:MAG: hypothetical protein PHP32_04490 [Candidatus Izemoplasmatales bacterium]|nr:hypothetical protein [Candidatus Izemoplasmatales bacterium]
MKKTLSMILILALSIVFLGCTTTTTTTTATTTTSENTSDTTTTTTEQVVHSIIVPNGGPALAQMYLQNNTEKYDVTVVNGPDPLVAAFGSSTYDYIFAGTNLGAKFYAANPEYLLVAIFTLGNTFILTETDDTFDLSYLDGKEIVVYGLNSTPDIVLKYVLEQNNIDCTLTYVDSVATATSYFIADPTKIILTAEPSLSVLLQSHPNLDIIDLQDEYATLSGGASYPQAGVFAKASLSNEEINDFLVDLAASIQLVNTSVEASAALGESLQFGFSATVLASAIPNNNLVYLSALDAKSSIEAYFTIIANINPVLIGGALPVDGFYYDPSR